MKITFLIPPPLDGKPVAERMFGCNYGIYPLANIFILYPATILKEAGHNVRILDCPVEKIDKKRFGEFVMDDDSDVYVFSTVFLSRNTDFIARDMIRNIKGASKFIFISVEPTGKPEEFTDYDSIAIRGETEETIRELVDALEKDMPLEDIKGISYKKEGVIKHNAWRPPIQDLDSLPFPDRRLIKWKKYYNPKLNKLPSTTILISRGCSYRCVYCVPHSLDFTREINYRNNNWDKSDWPRPPVRKRSVENTLKEFELIYNEGYKSVSIVDDQFIWRKADTIEICKGIEKFGFEWSCLARADHLLDEEMVSWMKRAGCKYVDMGVESFDQRILDDIQKDLKVESIYESCRLLKKYSIEPDINILIGSSPLETRETIAHTFREIKKLKVPFILIDICTPFPYTKFNKLAREKGWMITDEYVPIDPIRQSLISYPHLTKEEMEDIIRKAYKSFYLRPDYLFGRLRQIGSLKDLWHKMKVAMEIARM